MKSLLPASTIARTYIGTSLAHLGLTRLLPTFGVGGAVSATAFFAAPFLLAVAPFLAVN